MTVYESDIPGVGRRFELELTDRKRVVVVYHHDGRCELFRRDGPDDDGKRILDLTSDQASRLGTILEGAYFETVDVDELSVPLGDAIIEWIEVPAGSSLAGASLADADVRAQTGVSVVAIQRDTETIPSPGPEVTLRVGDILVGIGTRKEQAALEALVSE